MLRLFQSTTAAAARVASRWARPRGLLVVLPGYEPSLLAQEPVTAVSDLPPGVLAGLQRASLATLAEPLACAIHGVKQSSVRRADRVLIYGAGTLGILLRGLRQKAMT